MFVPGVGREGMMGPMHGHHPGHMGQMPMARMPAEMAGHGFQGGGGFPPGAVIPGRGYPQMNPLNERLHQMPVPGMGPVSHLPADGTMYRNRATQQSMFVESPGMVLGPGAGRPPDRDGSGYGPVGTSTPPSWGQATPMPLQSARDGGRTSHMNWQRKWGRGAQM